LPRIKDFSPDGSYITNSVVNVEVVSLVHSSNLEINSNKQWTSKSVFPYIRRLVNLSPSRPKWQLTAEQ